jgi:hypothetical protein
VSSVPFARSGRQPRPAPAATRGGRCARRLAPAAASALAALLAACASGNRLRVDLNPARESLQAARDAGAAEKAPEAFQNAQHTLEQAERLAPAGSPEARDAALRAEWSARLALSEAQCAARLADAANADKSPRAESERLNIRLRRSEEDLRRLEEQLALQRRELEVTETELIRTKARLKGIETKAEASSAIAEARILMRRLDARRNAAALGLCQDSIAKAEQQLLEDNFGAALFFALKAQTTALKGQEPGAEPARPREAAAGDPPAPKPGYVVKASAVNIRSAPAAGASVVGRAPRGSKLEATALRGDWVKVSFGSLSGWVALALLE